MTSYSDLIRSGTDETRFLSLDTRIGNLEAEMHNRRTERAFFVELLRVIGPKLGAGVLSGCASRALMTAAARGLPESRLADLQSDLAEFLATPSGGKPTM